MHTSKDYLKTNQKLWNDKTKVHINSDFYDVESFKQGKSSLNPIELKLLGNVHGLDVLHLQCHFGLDSMSLSRLGANVTAVDLSDEAIKEAKHLKNELKLNTRFITSDVYQLNEKLDKTFDIVFTSYGVLGWLPDMKKWAETVSHFLKPDGQLILVEFHPVVWMFSDDFKNIKYPYSSSTPIIETIKGSYTDHKAEIQNESVSWNHGLAHVIKALLNENLTITHFEEYNYSPYDCFKNTIESAKGQYQVRNLENKIPMLYSLVAQKKSKQA
jgi:2-polyprenyl-3-methyl-5-hydroxy-6-metoxy-1,4-benzoquinol methylase